MTSQSTISATTVVRGNVGGEGSLEILGRVEGDITMTDRVVVTQDAVIRGNVSASEIQVAGSIAGNLTASDTLLLNTGARVVGDLSGVRIGIAEGALVRGLVRTAGEPPLAKPTPLAAARPGVAQRAPLAASPARPAPAAMPPRSAVVPPRQPASSSLHEKPVAHERAADDSHSELAPLRHERAADGPPPLVVPSLRGQVKAKKKFKGR